LSDHEKGGKARFQVDISEEHSSGVAIVLVPIIAANALPSAERNRRLHKRSDEARLEEAVGLAKAIELDVVHSGTVGLAKIKPGTLFGSGKVDELKGLIAALDAGVVIIDHPLTPVQQRNLVREHKRKKVGCRLSLPI